MSFFINLFHYAFILPKTYRRLNIIKESLGAVLQEAKNNPAFKAVIDKKGFEMRLTQYVLVHSLLDMSLCGMVGREITSKELKSCVCFCACLPLFDDFFDEENMSAEQIQNLMQKDFDVQSESPKVKLFLHFFRQIEIADKDQFFKFFQKLFWAQEESKQLLHLKLPDEKTLKIAFEKGGYSALCFRAILDHPFLPGETEMLYQLGAVGQLMDDLFDLHDDYLEGVKTFALNNAESIEVVADSYFREVEVLKQKVKQLPVTKKKQEQFWKELVLMINGGVLCANQYVDLKEKYGAFELSKFQRNEVVCDMEDKRNWAKMVILSLKNG